MAHYDQDASVFHLFVQLRDMVLFSPIGVIVGSTNFDVACSLVEYIGDETMTHGLALCIDRSGLLFSKNSAFLRKKAFYAQKPKTFLHKLAGPNEHWMT
jgi:hypothetical protein